MTRARHIEIIREYIVTYRDTLLFATLLRLWHRGFAGSTSQRDNIHECAPPPAPAPGEGLPRHVGCIDTALPGALLVSDVDEVAVTRVDLTVLAAATPDWPGKARIYFCLLGGLGKPVDRGSN